MTPARVGLIIACSLGCGAVLGLWSRYRRGWRSDLGRCAILPAIQALEIPERRPTIQIVGFDGSVLATRGENARATSR